ncbi:hypothetical protein V7L32_005331 [Salmonella enterica]
MPCEQVVKSVPELPNGRVSHVINDKNIDRGFITTRVCLPVQDLRTGILKLTAVAGKIESYKPGRNPQSAPDHGADAMNSDFDDIDLHSQVTGIVME